MAYTPGLEQDVFISYAHIDNEPFGDGQRRWVSDFQEHLQTRLAMVLGNEAVVWRDPRLRGNQVVWETLESLLRESAVLVVVLSPRYVESESCRREMDCFEKTVAASRDFHLGSRRRIFKVEKTWVPRHRHPESLRALLGYELHWPDPATGQPRDLDLHPDPEIRRRYWTKLDDLAQDMAALLREMRHQRAPEPPPEEPVPRVRVYLASTTQDVRDERERLERELKDARCEVLPDRLLPDSAEELRATVRDALAQCRLSLHLIGGSFGMIPEGDHRSVVVLQHELAAERASRGKFSEIIWMRPNVQPREPAQREFITALELHTGPPDGFEFLKTDVETLKTVVLDKLRALPRAVNGSPTQDPNGSSSPRPAPLGELYLICDQRDQEAVQPLRRHLFDQRFEVTLPVWVGEVARVRELHEGNLRLCDVAVIYHGEANQAWFQAKLQDLKKAPGLGRTKPPLRAWVYQAPPRTPEKSAFQSHQFEVLDGFDGVPGERIARLTGDFRREREERP
jgi:hypothetical protein